MTDWKEYYDKTRDGTPDPALAFACARVGTELPKIAIDCGCGGGRGTAYLLAQGFRVYGFDADPAAEAFCTERFAGDDNASFCTATFSSFDYPRAALLAASYSLFFCPADEFATAWRKMTSAIMAGGIFSGTFLGPNDTWAPYGYVTEQPDLKIVTHSEAEIRSLFEGFDILEMDIKDFDGVTASGEEKHWHAITIVARRN